VGTALSQVETLAEPCQELCRKASSTVCVQTCQKGGFTRQDARLHLRRQIPPKTLSMQKKKLQGEQGVRRFGYDHSPISDSVISRRPMKSRRKFCEGCEHERVPLAAPAMWKHPIINLPNQSSGNCTISPPASHPGNSLLHEGPAMSSPVQLHTAYPPST
jgi:hypothetical protein